MLLLLLRCCLLPRRSTGEEAANITAHLTNLGSNVVAELGPVHAVIVLVLLLLLLVLVLVLVLLIMMMSLAATHMKGIAKEVHLV